MQLVSFQGRKVHGYLNFDVRFKSRLTFLVGLNGSGKTSVVRSVHALIDPRLAILATTKHQSMKLVVQLESRRVIISSATEDKSTVLRVSDVEEPLTIPAFVLPAGEPSYRTPEFEAKYFDDLGVKYASHPVVQRLAEMATPMYLGLERRAAFDRRSDSWAIYQRNYRSPTPRHQRAVFSGSMTESLGQAEALASWQLQTSLQAEARAADALRQKFISAAFLFVDATPQHWSARFPSKHERKAISARREGILSTLSALNSGGADITKAVDSYFKRLDDIFEHLPASGSVESTMNKQGLKPAERRAVGQWMFNKWQYDRILAFIEAIDIFIAERRKAYAAIDAYRDAVNDFLDETGKEIVVDPRGLLVKLKNGEERPISAMSSGEQQIVVLLTHLALNPSARAAGVLIIDEPELSLHLSWQQKFAGAILKTDPELQVVLATHSPTIILDRIEDCVEL